MRRCPKCHLSAKYVKGVVCANCDVLVHVPKIVEEGNHRREICPSCSFSFTPFLGVPSQLGISLPSKGSHQTNPFRKNKITKD